ncbi:MAG: restriction endonuclease subunit M [Bacteroidales bacterium]|nr:restriction endonuclease subunit M [Bacteroidales bacterium]
MSIDVDIRENDILQQDPLLLNILLVDRSREKHNTTTHNIIWATDNYQNLGPEYGENEQITIESITGEHGTVIQPRIRKTKEEQQARARDKGEVFTPSWICNAQNNLVDNQWFGKKNLFNKETEKGWKTNNKPVPFPTKKGKTWLDYVNDTRLEITCGEAPYIVSRYDTISGDYIPVKNRIGFLDRKLRVVSENTTTEDEWYEAAKKAYQASYAYEWQGDNLLLARENAIYTFIDYYQDKFEKLPSQNQLREIAEIISWNFWQMDGLKGVIPNSCCEREEEIPVLFGEPEKIITHCAGCEKDDIRKHNGIYCYIKDWSENDTLRFIDMIKP